jgi:hypothetical protein
MANLFPLILNTTSSTIEELPSGDNLNLTGSNISNVANITSAGNISASYYLGNGSALTGITASTAVTVTGNAQANITSVGTLTSLTVSGNLVPTNLVLDSFNETLPASANTSTSITPDVSLGTIFRYTANNNFTFNSLANAVAGTSATVIITQDATGSRLLTSTMKYAGNSKTLSTAASSIDIIGVFYDGTTYYASLTKGYA